MIGYNFIYLIYFVQFYIKIRFYACKYSVIFFSVLYLCKYKCFILRLKYIIPLRSYSLMALSSNECWFFINLIRSPYH